MPAGSQGCPTSAGMTGGSEARCIIHAVHIRVRSLFHLELAGGAHLDDHGPQQARVQVVASGGVVRDAHLPGDGAAPSARPRLPQGDIDPGRMIAQAPVPPALDTEQVAAPLMQSVPASFDDEGDLSDNQAYVMRQRTGATVRRRSAEGQLTVRKDE